MNPPSWTFATIVLFYFISRGNSQSNYFVDNAQPRSHKDIAYEYSYSVDSASSGVWTHSWERAKGGLVQGGYALLEPGGRVRSVRYEVDGPQGGFVAAVTTRSPGSYSIKNIYRSSRSQPSAPYIHARPVAYVQ